MSAKIRLTGAERRRGLRLHTIADPDNTAQTVVVDDAESPLAWLHRRRDRDGEALVSAEEFQAGERLRHDYTRAGLMPGLASNWRDASPVSGGGAGKADLTDLALAARQRVAGALAAVGPDLDAVLVDVCCFLKGLEQVETERRLPARSAKVILKYALARLATHYKPRTEAVGRAASSGVRHWGADDYRPGITR